MTALLGPGEIASVKSKVIDNNVGYIRTERSDCGSWNLAANGQYANAGTFDYTNYLEACDYDSDADVPAPFQARNHSEIPEYYNFKTGGGIMAPRLVGLKHQTL